MYLNCLLKKHFLFLLFVFTITGSYSSFAFGLGDARAPNARFESFSDSLSIDKTQQTLWALSRAALEDNKKSTNLIKHLIKGQHLSHCSEICKKTSLQLALPIDLEKVFFDFVKSFYLMFDISETRMGQIQKLKNYLITSRLNDENLVKLEPNFHDLNPGKELSTL